MRHLPLALALALAALTVPSVAEAGKKKKKVPDAVAAPQMKTSAPAEAAAAPLTPLCDVVNRMTDGYPSAAGKYGIEIAQLTTSVTAADLECLASMGTDPNVLLQAKGLVGTVETEVGGVEAPLPVPTTPMPTPTPNPAPVPHRRAAPHSSSPSTPASPPASAPPRTPRW